MPVGRSPGTAAGAGAEMQQSEAAACAPSSRRPRAHGGFPAEGLRARLQPPAAEPRSAPGQGSCWRLPQEEQVLLEMLLRPGPSQKGRVPGHS